MTLVNIIKKSFHCIIENPSLSLFFVIFLFALNFLSYYFMNARTSLMALIYSLCSFACICVFISGWFSVAKETTNREKLKSKNFYSLFLEGIGKNIISVTIAILIYLTIFGIVVFLIRELCIHLFGTLEFLKNMPVDFKSNSELIDYFNNLKLTDEQTYTIYLWQLMFIVVFSMFHLLSLFYFPIIFYSNSNVFKKPFITILKSIKFTFKHFLSVFAIFIIIHFTHILLIILNAVFQSNMVISLLLLFLYIYFVSFCLMLLFNYYDEKVSKFPLSE